MNRYCGGTPSPLSFKKPRYLLWDAYTDRTWPTNDLLVWAEWFERGKSRRVGYIQYPWGDTCSTVALGMDHSFGGPEGLYFETMLFPEEKHDYLQWRYPTPQEAKRGHGIAAAIGASRIDRWDNALNFCLLLAWVMLLFTAINIWRIQ